MKKIIKIAETNGRNKKYVEMLIKPFVDNGFDVAYYDKHNCYEICIIVEEDSEV